MQTSALPKTLSLERCVNLLAAPINFHLATIYILVDRHHPLRYIHVCLLAFLEHLEHEIATNRWIVCVTKVLVHSLLERLDAFSQLLGIVRVHQLLEYRARVRRALRNGLSARAWLAKKCFGGFDKFLGIVRLTPQLSVACTLTKSLPNGRRITAST